MGNVDYHAQAALERVQAILRKLENDSWEFVPTMVESNFYVHHPEARRILNEPGEKHLRAYKAAETLTGEQIDLAQRLTQNLMGEITDATITAFATVQSALIGRIEPISIHAPARGATAKLNKICSVFSAIIEKNS